MTAEAKYYATCIVLSVVAVVLLFVAHGSYISACMASGNTRTYCEFNFWK